MKKLLLSIAVLLPGLLAHSQEADDLGRYAEVTIIPRLDINPTLNTAESGVGFNHGNSSIYTLFEGSASEHFSWTVANHWLQAGGDYGWPYTSLGRSDTTNWLDFFRADITFGGWTMSLGKDLISTGGFEYEDWDWDTHSAFWSPLFEGLSCYQWGGKIAYATKSEMSSFSLQMTTSPYGEHPFSSNLWAYSAQWRGEYGWFSNIWSVSMLEYDKGSFDCLISLGQQFSFDAWSLTVDWSNNSGFSEESWTLLAGHTFQGKLTYAPSDKFDISLRGFVTTAPESSSCPDRWNAGSVFQYYPLHDSDDLRLHAYLAYDSLLGDLAFSIGARYNIRLKVW